MHLLFVFLAALLVDIVPFIGPPAWTVMVFFQIKYDLNIWLVLVVGVAGSALGRYILSLYMPILFAGRLTEEKTEDIQFIGDKLSGKGWRVKLFVLLYSLVPLPTTPLFTAAGMARVSTANIIPAFIVGKFISDMVMVLSGDFAASNAMEITHGMVSWKSITGIVVGIVILIAFFFIDWRCLIKNKQLRFDFHIWKHK